VIGFVDFLSFKTKKNDDKDYDDTNRNETSEISLE
jgi:hypothetical protein